MSSCSYLFVYGTLLNNSEHPMARFLCDNATFVDFGFMYGKLYEVEGYPGAVATGCDEERVEGQIYELYNNELVFRELDSYEEIGNGFAEPYEYIREIVQIYAYSSESVNCWVYLYNWPVDDLQFISSGNYEDYCKRIANNKDIS